MNLVLLHPEDKTPEGAFRLVGRRAKHVREVHRVEVGDTLTVGEVNGRLGRGTVLGVDAQTVLLDVVLVRDPPVPPGIDLLLAMPRPKILRKVLAAATSLGVKRLVLVNSARVEKSYFDSPLLAPDELRPHLELGLEQARDTVLPEVVIEKRFRPFVEDRLAEVWPDGVRKLLAHPIAPGPVESVDPGSPRDRAVVAIGPEGGWVPFEIELLTAQGFAAFDLGPRILRVDTAVPVILAQLELARRLRAAL